MSVPAVLSVSHLVKRYGDTEVVRDISFAIPPGRCFGLLGPNGAGKTTTLRCCLGLTAASAGQIVLNGHPVPQAARLARQQVGIVPQLDSLDPDFTVAENLMVYGRYFGLSDAVLRTRITPLLEFASLTSKEHARIQALSGGMKRRLTLARALINNPDILFLDEPTTGLDPQARHVIWDRLKKLLAQGKTILLTTHFMEEAERLCDELAIMDYGRIVTQGSPRALIEAHIEPQVVEVYGTRDGVDVGEWVRERAGNLAARVEMSGETAFCYARDPHALLRELARRPELRYVHRAASLEDVFLKLTGRELRD